MAKSHKRTDNRKETNPLENLTSLWAFRMLMKLGARSGLDVMMLIDDDDLYERLDFKEFGINDETDKGVMRKFLQERLGWYESLQPRIRGPLKKNLKVFGQLVGMDETSLALLGFTVVLHNDRTLDSIADAIGKLNNSGVVHALAVILDLPEQSVFDAMSVDGVLNRSGIIRLDRTGTNFLGNKLQLMEALANVLMEQDANADTLLREFFVRGREPALLPGDYEYLDTDYSILRKYLKQSVKESRAGVNILVYGEPGTGKSELARTLCGELGLVLFEISVTEREGESLKSMHRLGAYQLSQCILSRKQSAVILFDEIEDVFPTEPFFLDRSRVSKGWINELLESNPVPAIWISNNIEQIDKAYIRRFDYVLKLGLPPRQVRQRILAQHLEGLAVSEHWLERVAENSSIAPGLVAKAARVARVVAGREAGGNVVEQLVERLLTHSLTAMGHPGAVMRQPHRVLDYDLGFLNTSIPLSALADGLGRVPNARLCLYGPPGTGKTEFGRYLANNLGKSLLVRRASDLLGPYVGMTEKGIAQMFEHARQQDAVLMLDEADSFLQDRRNARNNWEVSMVNEMLTQMEMHEGIFICSTNLEESLDPASLRRFDFKIHFDYLDPEQAWSLFCLTLAGEQGIRSRPPGKWKKQLSAFHNLTPGDFANVRRQQALSREPLTPAHLLTLLGRESEMKGGSQSRGVGFLAEI